MLPTFPRANCPRDDGYVYTIDAGQMLICAALAGDERAYRELARGHCVNHLINADPKDEYAWGYVGWRYREGEPIDASGTTEALRVARGLWIGAGKFSRPEDAETARRVLKGYAHHATTDQGVWIIRNYFNYKTRSFATNSFLVDYDPDFVDEVAKKTLDQELIATAANSLRLIRAAVTPCGLLYDLVQPDLKTLYPLLDVYTFSPNDVVGLSGCGTTALGVTRGEPQIGIRIVQFATERFADLRRYYYGRTGEPVNSSSAASFEYTTLARLAAQLGDERSSARIVARRHRRLAVDARSPSVAFHFHPD